MDVNSVYKNLGYIIGNPKYSKNKKNTEPPTLISTDDKYGSGLANAFAKHNNQFGKIYTDNDRVKQLVEYGVTPNIIDDNKEGSYENQLAENQSAGEKLWHGLARAAVNEVGIGSVKAFSDLADVIGSKVFKASDDYTNPVSQTLKEWQDAFEQRTPIFDYQRGSDSNFIDRASSAGWWANNLPSIMSSLTLMIPAKAVTATASYIAKLTNASRYARGTIRSLSGVNRAIKGLEGAEKVEAIRNLNAFQRSVNSLSNQRFISKRASDAIGGTVMRAVENYQEGQQVYSDMIKTSLDQFNSLNDIQFAEWCRTHQGVIKNMPTDKQRNPTREDVAKHIAKEAADRTFREDWANLIFDIWQLHELKNPLQLTKNMRSTAATRIAEREAKAQLLRQAGKSEEFIAKKLGNKRLHTIGVYGKGFTGILGSELSEGIEEGVNYIAQEEGLHYGNVMLGTEKPSAFNTRLASYARNPDLYDAMFWGVLGGVTFHLGGSAVNRAEQLARKSNDPATKDDKKFSWFDRFELAENKRRTADINSRLSSATDLASKIKLIKSHKNPFDADENGFKPLKSGSVEETLALNKAIDQYVTNTTLRALENGNYDMLKEYLQDENVIEGFKELGITDDTSGAFAKSLVEKMDKVANSYYSNITLLDALAVGIDSKNERIPIEYVQAIAQDNVAMDLNADIAQEEIDENLRRASALESSYTNNDESKKLEVAEEQQKIRARAYEKQLGVLYASRKEILSDKDKTQSISGQIELRNINRKINVLNNELEKVKSQIAAVDATNLLSNRLETLLSSLRFKNVNQQQIVADNTDFDYLRLKKAFKDKDSKLIAQLTKDVNLFGDESSLELSKEDLDAMIGNEETAGVLNFDRIEKGGRFESKLQKENPQLYQYYEDAAYAESVKAWSNANKVNTVEKFQLELTRFKNEFRDAKDKAMKAAYDTIKGIIDDYDSAVVTEYIRTGKINKMVSNADAKKLKDAIEIFNLTKPENEYLSNTLLSAIRAYEENKFNKKANEKSTKSPIESLKTNEPNNTSQSTQNAATMQRNAVSEPKQTPVHDNSDYQDVSLNFITSNATDSNVIIGDEEDINTRITNVDLIAFGDNDEYLLMPNANTNIDELYAKVPSFFRKPGYAETYPISKDSKDTKTFISGNSNKENGPLRMIGYPVVKIDDNNNIILVRPGRLSYGMDTPISSTGEVQKSSLTPEEVIAIKNDNPKVDAEAVEQKIAKEQEERNKRTSNINSDIMAKVIKSVKDGLSDTDIETELSSYINETYKDTNDNEIAKKVLNSFLNIRRANNKFNKNVATVIALNNAKNSSAGEQIIKDWGGITNITDAVKNIITEFVNDTSAPIVTNSDNKKDKKRIISFEALLRYINKYYEEDSARFVYDSLKSYLINTKDGVNNYVVIDNVNDALLNSSKSLEIRKQELLGTTISNNINILDAIYEAHEALKNGDKDAYDKYFKALNNLKVGDTLTVSQASEGRLNLTTQDGVVIGSLPIINISNNNYVANNRFWNYVIPINGDVTKCPLNVWLKNILTEKENNSLVHKELNELLYNLAVQNADDTALDIFKNNEDIKKAIESGLLTADTDEDYREAMNHLASIYRYKISAELMLMNDSMLAKASSSVNETLDAWFTKLYKAYEATNDLVNNHIGTSLTVSAINSGEIIENEDGHYNSSVDSIAEPDKVSLALIKTDKSKNKIITDVNGNTYMSPIEPNQGTLYFMTKNANGTDGYIKAASVRINDTNVKGIAKNIVSTINKNLDKLYLSDKPIDVNALLTFLSNSTNGLFKSYNLEEVRTDDDNNIVIKLKNDNFELLVSNDGKTKQYRFTLSNGEVKTISHEELTNNEDLLNVVKDKLNDFKSSIMFNVPFDFIRINKNKQNYNRGGLSINHTDKTINITTTDIYGKTETTTFNGTLEEFFVNSGFIKVNTRIEDGSNWAHRPTRNHKAAKRVEVSMEINTSSPVEEMTDTNQQLSTTEDIKNRTLDVINNPRIKNKGEAIINALFGENGFNTRSGKSLLNALKRLRYNGITLIPSTILYDNSVVTDHEAATKDNIVYIGDVWCSIAEENPSRAIRILIHEQLHNNINNLSEADKTALFNSIEPIMAEYENAIKDLSNNDRLSVFLFNDSEHPTKESRIEEFLIESITNRELFDVLNSIKAKDINGKEEKDNLWQKIIKTIAKWFGWNIKEGSLFDKEFKTISNISTGLTAESDIQTTTDSVTTFEKETTNDIDTETKNDDLLSPTQLYLNLDYEDSNTLQVDDNGAINVDDIDINDDESYYYSTAGEYSSPNSMINQQSLSDRPALADSIERGDISISCRWLVHLKI